MDYLPNSVYKRLWSVVFLAIMLISPISACETAPQAESGMEEICPVPPEDVPQELIDKGLGGTRIIDEFVCEIPSHNEIGLWCEDRIDDDTNVIYRIIYFDERREKIRGILKVDKETGEMIKLYDVKSFGASF